MTIDNVTTAPPGERDTLVRNRQERDDDQGQDELELRRLYDEPSDEERSRREEQSTPLCDSGLVVEYSSRKIECEEGDDDHSQRSKTFFTPIVVTTKRRDSGA